MKNQFLEALKRNKAAQMGRIVNKSVSLNDMDLSELREKHPEIKARSKAEFLKKLNENV
jgi:hypothetical protein